MDSCDTRFYIGDEVFVAWGQYCHEKAVIRGLEELGRYTVEFTDGKAVRLRVSTAFLTSVASGGVAEIVRKRQQ